MTINILGAPYRVVVKKYGDDKCFDREDAAGYCDGLHHQIVLCDMTTYKGWENEAEENCNLMQRQTLRHEIVHAFLDESGIQSNSADTVGPWARNEEMVDWIAIQGPKIYAAWKEADTL